MMKPHDFMKAASSWGQAAFQASIVSRFYYFKYIAEKAKKIWRRKYGLGYWPGILFGVMVVRPVLVVNVCHLMLSLFGTAHAQFNYQD